MTDQIEEKLASLTPRQKEVMRYIARHYRDKEIARLMNISEHTARAHADAVRQKLGGVSRREAARFLSDHVDALGIHPEREYQSPGMAHIRHQADKYEGWKRLPERAKSLSEAAE